MKCQKLSIKIYNSKRLLWAFKFCPKKLDELYCVARNVSFLLQYVQGACMIAMVIVIVVEMVVMVWCVVVARREPFIKMWLVVVVVAVSVTTPPAPPSAPKCVTNPPLGPAP